MQNYKIVFLFYLLIDFRKRMFYNSQYRNKSSTIELCQEMRDG